MTLVLSDTFGELRRAARALLRERSFTLAALVTLSLALGATTLIWSIADAVVLRPLPFPESERLVSVGNDWDGSIRFEHANQSLAEMADVATLDHAFAEIAAYRSQSYNLTAGAGGPERLQGVETTPGFFELLGVPAARGRTYEAGNEGDVVVLSHGLWQRRFGGDPSILGRRLRLGATRYEVIGILPAAFAFPDAGAHLWIPVQGPPEVYTARGWRAFRTLARLRPDATFELAEAEIARLASRLRQEHPDLYADPRASWDLSLRGLHRQVVGDARPALLLLVAAVAFVTAIACTNVASLFLTRAARRRRELAVRAALGAGGVALLRQMAAEGVVLAVAASVLGWLVAVAGLESVLRMMPHDLPRLSEVRLDARVFLVVLAVAVLVGLLIGVATFLGARRSAVVATLARRDGGAVSPRARHALVAVQTALALVLLVGAGLMLRSLERLQHVDPGVRPQGVTVARVALDAGRYADGAARARLFGDLLQGLRARPEVAAAGAVSRVPLRDGTSDWSVAVSGSSVVSPEQVQFEQSRQATDGYFETVGVPILDGRDFAASDDSDGPPVAIVSVSFARRYWPDRSPLGQTIQPGGPGSSQPARRVVGVVGDVLHDSLDESPAPTFYLPVRQDPTAALTVAVRGRDGHDVIAALRRELAALDPEQALDGVQPLAEVVSAASGATRFQARVLGAFAFLSLALAALGTYGVVAYLVEQERRDFGIKLALGARGGALAGLVLRRTAAVAGGGLVAGLAVAFAGTRLMRRLLFQVHPADPAILAAATTLLLAVALAAAWLPARRAARVDPIEALRSE